MSVLILLFGVAIKLLESTELGSEIVRKIICWKFFDE